MTKAIEIAETYTRSLHHVPCIVNLRDFFPSESSSHHKIGKGVFLCRFVCVCVLIMALRTGVAFKESMQPSHFAMRMSWFPCFCMMIMLLTFFTEHVITTLSDGGSYPAMYFLNKL
jgi:hypothetical protein